MRYMVTQTKWDNELDSIVGKTTESRGQTFVILTEEKEYKLKISRYAKKPSHSFPVDINNCVIVVIKDGNAEILGFFSKVYLSIEPKERILMFLSPETVYKKTDVEKFMHHHSKRSKLNVIDEQNISIDHFVYKLRLKKMLLARKLLKEAKDV